MNLEAKLSHLIDHLLTLSGDQTPIHLAHSIRYSLLSPGKRMRPRLFLAACRMLDIPPETGLPAALSIEMLHCFTLIHDDLPCMDNDDFRRGLPSNHRKFGETLALLAGDALLALAVEAFLEVKIEPEKLQKGLKRLMKSIGPRGVIGGQAAENQLNSSSSLTDLLAVHRQKTVALFEAALLIPMDFADVLQTSSQGQILTELSQAFGSIFQMADDLEDKILDSVPPSNILFFQDAQKVALEALETIQKIGNRIKNEWGEKSDEMLHLLHELSKKILPSQPELRRQL